MARLHTTAVVRVVLHVTMVITNPAVAVYQMSARMVKRNALAEYLKRVPEGNG